MLGAGGAEITVFTGSLADVTSPARTFSPLVGAEIGAVRGGDVTIPLARGHEHVIFVARGSAAANGNTLAPGSLLYLATGRGSVTLAAGEGARLFLLGGEPLGETLLMWWNFVGRTPEDIIAAAQAWAADSGRFGDVRGYRGAPLAAPPLDPVRLARRSHQPG